MLQKPTVSKTDTQLSRHSENPNIGLPAPIVNTDVSKDLPKANTDLSKGAFAPTSPQKQIDFNKSIQTKEREEEKPTPQEKRKVPPKEKSNPYLQAYDSFCHKQLGIPPNRHASPAADRKALRSIESYLEAVAWHHYPKASRQLIAEKKLTLWQKVLTEWNTIKQKDAFLSRQTRLVQIAANIQQLIQLNLEDHQQANRQARHGEVPKKFNTNINPFTGKVIGNYISVC
ncbi:hypothetical protein V6R21_24640 [Limibacter armeniacum]|uniref:hypothetical protein n=1 Tax=Limibacter armeniacum TaxID=466084 RepID=UPI002FE642C8